MQGGWYCRTGASQFREALRTRAGFVRAGQMHSVGRKHGRWLDTLYMQLALNEDSLTQINYTLGRRDE